jgi:hypothetical protein
MKNTKTDKRGRLQHKPFHHQDSNRKKALLLLSFRLLLQAGEPDQLYPLSQSQLHPSIHRTPAAELLPISHQPVIAAEISSATSEYATSLFSQDGLPESDALVDCETPFDCPFWFLDCDRRYTDEAEWRDHALSHFGMQRPPRNVQCPLSFCSFRMSSDDGYRSWDYRMDHVAEHHVQGYTLSDSRPDFHLFDYLWKIRIISTEVLLELKGNWRAIQGSSYDTAPARVTQRECSRLHRRNYWNDGLPSSSPVMSRHIIQSEEDYRAKDQMNPAIEKTCGKLERLSMRPVDQTQSSRSEERVPTNAAQPILPHGSDFTALPGLRNDNGMESPPPSAGNSEQSPSRSLSRDGLRYNNSTEALEKGRSEEIHHSSSSSVDDIPIEHRDVQECNVTTRREVFGVYAEDALETSRNSDDPSCETSESPKKPDPGDSNPRASVKSVRPTHQRGNRISPTLNTLMNAVSRWARPKIPDGYRRIEWKCVSHSS